VKKYLVYSIIILIILSSSCNSFKALPHDNHSGSAVELSQILISGHRGAMGTDIENTIPSFSAAIAAGVNIIELDIQQTKDGQVIVFHDSDLFRLTGVHGAIDNHTWSELQELRVTSPSLPSKQKESIPSLIEVLDFILLHSPDVVINIELKNNQAGDPFPNLLEKTIAIVRDYKIQSRIILSSFNLDEVARVKQLEPEIKSKAIISADFFKEIFRKYKKEGTVEKVAELLSEAGFDWVAVNKIYCNASLVNALKNRNIITESWVINSMDEFTQAAELGIDAITTNFPELLIKERKGF
jgi:glycerophosphoryl diester phosphodiesterase